jgi:hypothetical protein
MRHTHTFTPRIDGLAGMASGLEAVTGEAALQLKQRGRVLARTQGWGGR